MARLILHIGPGKCGSSSVQDFFHAQHKPCNEDTAYVLLSAIKIDQLNKNKDDQTACNYFKEILSKNLIGDKIVILSHEYLFQTPSAVNEICVLAEDIADEISIIGYSRQQSGFLISQYSQWLFRSPSRVKEVNKYLDHYKIDKTFFTGLERQLIASIYSDFKCARMIGDYEALNWDKSYQRLATQLTNKQIKISCGLLPSKKSSKTLIQDFCDKAKLAPSAEAQKRLDQASNPSFSPDIVEAMNNAITHKFSMPDPHSNNALIQSLSLELSKTSNQNTDFIRKLKAYIDGYYWESNQSHCNRYQLDQNYFANPEPINKADITNIIETENNRRQQNPAPVIDSYRELNAKLIELCIKLSDKQ